MLVVPFALVVPRVPRLHSVASTHVGTEVLVLTNFSFDEQRRLTEF